MRLAYFDCFSGISGDMLLGAFIDLGLPLEQLKRELSCLGLNEYRLETSKEEKCGIFGTKLNVVVEDDQIHHHRHLGDIEAIIRQSSLDGWVKDQSISIFEKIAEAEGRIHNLSPERVHFHEVGAVDAIVDVVGAVLCVRLLEIDCIYSSPLPMGRGFVKTAHGVVPLPAPATAELLREIPVYWVDSDKELVTPTGAAILKGLACEFGRFPPVRWEQIGYGCGSNNRKVPNMLRVFVGWC